MILKRYFLLVLLLGAKYSFAQNSDNDLESFEVLKSRIEKTQDTTRKILYAKLYIQRAKNLNDSLNIAEGFAYLSDFFPSKKNLEYADSAIHYSKNFKTSIYPEALYAAKGYYHIDLGNYNKAWDNYLKAFNIAELKNNEDYALPCLGILIYFKIYHTDSITDMNMIHDYHNRVLKQSEESVTYYDNLYYSYTHYIDAYLKLKKFDSARVWIDKGLEQSIKSKEDRHYYNFLTYNARLNYETRNFAKAKKDYNEVLSDFDDISPSIYYYLGKIAVYEKDQIEAIQNFNKVDSIYKATDNLISELRDTYKALIENARIEGDKVKQLEYLNKFFEVDSLLDAEKISTLNNYHEKIDIAHLESERKALEAEFNEQKSQNKAATWIIIIISVVSIVVLILNFRKSRIYKKRFEELMARNSETEEIAIPVSENKSLNDEIRFSLLQKLHAFESNKEFLDSTISLNSLSKNLETNSTYLSKIINDERGKNFSQYLKDLRIDYVVSKLKTDKKWRNYTTESLAKEIGFNSTTTFYTAFKDHTGITPAYFIKNLK